jgi:hypothetical protein
MEITLTGSGQEKGRVVSGHSIPKYLFLLIKLVEAATITSPYESMHCAAKRQKCPHRYPQIDSTHFHLNVQVT